jgi:nucleoside-diphosphate-sugar epimerase
MRVLVTGANGGLGRNVVEAAVGRGHEVRALVRDASRAPKLDGVEWLQGDARDRAAVSRAATGCAALFHLVNVNFATDWVQATAALLDVAIAACRETDARLVFPANVWIYGRGDGTPVAEDARPAPCSTKGHARARKEERIRASGVRFTMLRLPEFYGPHVQTLTGPPLMAIAHGRTATWFGPADVPIELVYMPDGAAALLEVGLNAPDGETFHLPGAAVTTPRRFFALACELANGGSLRALPAWVVRAAGLVSPKARGFADILHLWTDPIVLDGTKLRTRFPNLTSTSYRDGLTATLAWLRANPRAPMHY